MSLKVGIIMDPIDEINFKKDSSLAMLWAAQRKGWSLWYMEQTGLFSRDGVVHANMAPLSVDMNPEKWFERGDYSVCPITDLDVILMRKDPPFEQNQGIANAHPKHSGNVLSDLITENP
jgi:glutathione synthase